MGFHRWDYQIQAVGVDQIFAEVLISSILAAALQERVLYVPGFRYTGAFDPGAAGPVKSVLGTGSAIQDGWRFSHLSPTWP